MQGRRGGGGRALFVAVTLSLFFFYYLCTTAAQEQIMKTLFEEQLKEQQAQQEAIRLEREKSGTAKYRQPLSKKDGQPLPTVIVPEKHIWDVGDHYLCVTLDFHSPVESKEAWGNASVLSIDLEHPRLNNLAKRLAPTLLRLGGGPQDRTVYKVNGFQCDTWFCLTMDRWDAINRFTRRTGLRLVMGLNALYGRTLKQLDSKWDPRNTYAFLKHTARKGYPVFAFGYGNELGKKLEPNNYIDGLIQVKEWIDKFWPDPATRPLYIGPDINQDDGMFGALVLTKAGKHVNAFTWHLYTGFGLDENLGASMKTPQFYASLDELIRILLTDVRHSLGNTEIWVGESAAAWYSGRNEVTNRFLSSFWYTIQLGLLAQYNHKGFCRQAMVGGWYGLLNWTDFTPNPDYWLLLIWKQTMDTKVYSLTKLNLDPLLFVFCHSAPGGGRTFAIVNVNSVSQGVWLTGHGIHAELRREEYWLTAERFESRQVFLNGKPLKLTPDDTVPPLIPKETQGPSDKLPEGFELDPKQGHWVDMPAASIVYIRFLTPDAIPFKPVQSEKADLEFEEEDFLHPAGGGDVSNRNWWTATIRTGQGKFYYLPTYGQALLWLTGMVAFALVFMKWVKYRTEERIAVGVADKQANDAKAV